MLGAIHDYQCPGRMAGAKDKAIGVRGNATWYTLPGQALQLGFRLRRETGVLGHTQRKIAAWDLGD